MKTIVLSLGGSILAPDNINISFLRQFKALLDRFSSFRFIIVCGGGKPARAYQEAAQELVPSIGKDSLDWVGIMATRLNAELVRVLFGEDAHAAVIIDPKERLPAARRIIVAAGYQPGHSTDMDAVLLAKNIRATLVVNLSNIEFVYDKDPKKFKDAKKLENLSWKRFRALVGDTWAPGMNVPFDPVASKEAEQSGMTVIIAKGNDLDNLKKIILGKPFRGTKIQ
ncbi:UMP kinase [Candidatus Woesearchaeota archaeon]|nr:UMP kinase [Candidatus Woesearchaeota archaeon]